MGATAPLVLVVDDYSDGREMLAEYLQFVGFRVEEARTGVEALDKVKSMLPDVVVLDLALPDMDGLQVLAHLNELALVPAPKVAIWTARVLDNIRQRVAASGVTVFIPKPCEPSVIAAQIADLAADAHAGSARRAEPA
jgi:CheY-like chemotaxis protein